MGNLNSQMGHAIKADGKKVSCTDMVFINGKMDQNIKVLIKMEKNKEMVYFSIHQVNNMLANGLMENKKGMER